MLKVEGNGKFERVSGSNLGGGTFWGLCRLMTRCKGFDEMLALSAKGNNAKVTRSPSCVHTCSHFNCLHVTAHASDLMLALMPRATLQILFIHPSMQI